MKSSVQKITLNNNSYPALNISDCLAGYFKSSEYGYRVTLYFRDVSEKERIVFLLRESGLFPNPQVSLTSAKFDLINGPNRFSGMTIKWIYSLIRTLEFFSKAQFRELKNKYTASEKYFLVVLAEYVEENKTLIGFNTQKSIFNGEWTPFKSRIENSVLLKKHVNTVRQVFKNYKGTSVYGLTNKILAATVRVEEKPEKEKEEQMRITLLVQCPRCGDQFNV